MSTRELQEQLKTLRDQLEQNPPLSLKERDHLQELSQQIEARIRAESATEDPKLADGVNLAVERFEIDHPALAVTLRNIGVALANMGI
ncbi:DUF4404 family protein [Streptomyces sp. G-G2]|uniref:DUF4404 family protein n=1 Tax=Streptomyces sp. G-G2 TaxID=3046201 RepID=UPI0024BB3ADE|nr:DUF4404 family protein [Streptomyces sp. G-G2]MDJ0380374.1 DUF4404 family protein [Streptomyces sp. G-G2]